eukprot:scaffold17628_cov77-Cyclotella_meneghiniana.AAC.2
MTVSCIDRPLTQGYPKGLLVRPNELQQMAVDARLPNGLSGPDKCLYLKLLVQLFVCWGNVVIATLPTFVVSGGSEVGSKRNTDTEHYQCMREGYICKWQQRVAAEGQLNHLPKSL